MTYVDAHVHFWDAALGGHAWVADTGLPDRMTIADYRAATADDPPESFVVVEADAGADHGAPEARWIDELCRRAPDVAGIVVWAPIDRGPDATIRHLDALALDTVVGVRRLIQAEPPGFACTTAFVAGVAAVGSRDLPFDVCIHAHQLDDTIELARRTSGTRLVLDHCAKPPIADGDLADWRTGLATLAGFDHVTCKLSGLVTEADHDGWTVADLRPVVDVALESFGPDRLIWGSDWPVVLHASSHRRWREATAELLADLSADERHAVLHANALATYTRGDR